MTFDDVAGVDEASWTPEIASFLKDKDNTAASARASPRALMSARRTGKR